MNYILSGCPTALAQGKFMWRHDKVLRELAQTMEEKRRDHNKGEKRALAEIVFVKAGEKKKKISAKSDLRTYMKGSKDWRLQVDLDSKLKIPHNIVEMHGID